MILNHPKTLDHCRATTTNIGTHHMNFYFHPTILECKRFITESSGLSAKRIVKDYEFDYYVKGNRIMYINDQRYHIKSGSLVLRKPGQTTCSEGDYDCYIITLDFSGRVLKNYSRNSALKIQPLFDSPMWDMIPAVFEPYHREDYIRIFEDLLSKTVINSKDSQTSLPLVNEFLHLVISDALSAYSQKRTVTTDFVDDIRVYLNTHYQEDLTLEKLADMVYMNKYHLARKFKDRTGLSPINYLIQVRMNNAKRMLLDTNLTVKAIAQRCGYSDAAYFNYFFRKNFGITPIQYRNLYME